MTLISGRFKNRDPRQNSPEDGSLSGRWKSVEAHEALGTRRDEDSNGQEPRELGETWK